MSEVDVDQAPLVRQEWYGREIMPTLELLAYRCKKHGVAFFAAGLFTPGTGDYLHEDESGVGPSIDEWIKTVIEAAQQG